MIREFLKPAPERVDTSPRVSDEVKTTTCYMCACRCGIRVHMLDGQIRYIEGNPDHPVNKGVLCAKGSAGIMNHYSPAKLSKPLKRVGERGRAEFQEIEWDEALRIATGWLDDVRNTDPRRLAFFTGRDQSQGLTGWWASQFGTPNYAAHGGFCSVNMAAAGLYTIGGSFWEFGEPDWERTRLLLMFGVAEDHDSNPIKAGLTKLKRSGAKYISVNPIRTGYSAIADEWVGIRPGTDGMLVLALIHELLRAGKVDLDYIVRYTNLPWLVIRDPGGAEDGLFARGDDNEPLCWDSPTGQAADARLAGVAPALKGEFTLADGRRAVPAFQLMAERYLSNRYSPEAAARETGIAASTIRRIAAELADAAFEREIVVEQKWTDWAGREHDRMIGRPVSMHAMRGISAHSNGFHTCRAIHVLQILLGSIDCPGGFLYKPPFPKAAPPGLRPAGRAEQVGPGQPMPGPPLGFPQGPEDLLVEPDGTPRRIDKAFSWDAPMAVHGMMHMAIHNAWAQDPYPVDVLFLYMANMAWNSSMNTAGTIEKLTARDEATGEYRIPKIIYADAYFSEMVAYADLVLPDTTYLERWDCISLLDRPICSAEGPADAIRQPVVAPDRDVRPFQDVLIDLGARLGLPGLVGDDGKPRYPGGYADYMVNHERAPGIGMLAGWRGKDGGRSGTGAPNPDQLQRYIENGCFWRSELEPGQRYFRFANRDYLEYAVSMGFAANADQIILQVYSEPMQRFRLAAQGHGPVQPPDEARARIEAAFDPLPVWYPPFEGAALRDEDFPLHALTQRPMAMYHSWGSQNAWLRQIHGTNPIYINRGTGVALGIKDGEWVWVTSHHGRIKGCARLMDGVEGATVWTWNAIGKREGAWNLAPDSPEAKTGVLLNHAISELLPERDDGMRWSNSDPVTGQAAWYDLRVRVEKAAEDEPAESAPRFDPIPPLPSLPERPGILRYGLAFSRAWRRLHGGGE
jgi:anaerobic selenocysteine-containing dehydrogenase